MWVDYTTAIAKTADAPISSYFTLRAISLTRKERFAEALVDLDRALELNPKSSKALFNRAIVLSDHSKPPDFSQALSDLDSAIAIVEVPVVREITISSTRKMMNSSGNSNINGNINSNEERIDVFTLKLLRGDILRRVGKFSDVISDMRSCLALDPESSIAWQTLGMVSKQSERALRKMSILEMNPAKWLQTAKIHY
tara:strand:+ start:359 stop:949 length:591 start_codon:yes stop_codon:yes gene_type:complete